MQTKDVISASFTRGAADAGGGTDFSLLGRWRGDERTDETARFHFSSNEMCNVLEVSSN